MKHFQVVSLLTSMDSLTTSTYFSRYAFSLLFVCSIFSIIFDTSFILHCKTVNSIHVKVKIKPMMKLPLLFFSLCQRRKEKTNNNFINFIYLFSRETLTHTGSTTAQGTWKKEYQSGIFGEVNSKQREHKKRNERTGTDKKMCVIDFNQ